jgi:hypothetical protein
LCGFCNCHRGLLFLLSACLHILIYHPTTCAMFVSLPYITLCCHYCCLFELYGIESALLAFAIIMFFSRNIVASLHCCNVNHFIP